MKPFHLIPLAIATQEGAFTACYSSNGLASLEFPSGKKSRTVHTRSVPAKVRLWHERTSRAVRAALAGCAPKCLPPLDLAVGTEFQRRVWAALRRIRPGRTMSYAELARTVGKSGAARVVGQACGANPLPVLVPCHRVLAADGSLGGFSAGLRWKRLLLEREGTFFR